MKPIDLSTVRMGSDAEVFLEDVTGRLFPVCGLIGGTKAAPRKLTDDGVAVQEDNVMLEFNTAISSDASSWCKNIARAQRLAYAQIPPSFRPRIDAVARFDQAFLQSEQAQTFGCEPDFNAWTMEQNPRPIPTDPLMRSAAAHVHLSWKDPENMDQRCRVIQMADIFVTLPSLNESKDTERRGLYGKAGAFRPKEYGVEHRVLDNYWIAEPSYVEMIWYRYADALRAANTPFEITSSLSEKIQDIINNYKRDEAQTLWGELCDTILPHEKAAKPLPRRKKAEVVYDNWITTTLQEGAEAPPLVWGEAPVIRVDQ